MPGTLNVGVIGCGNISSAYFRLSKLFQPIEVKACADLNAEIAQAQAEQFGLEALSVEDLISHSELDIVVNLTVPNAHFAVSKAILEAGKHVYSEKPLTLSLEDGLALRDLAEQKGLRVACTPDTFLGGTHQQARAMIDAGKLGEIVGGTCHVLSHGMEHWHPNPDFFFQPGGGPVLDLGPYYIGNLIHLLGPVRYVTAMSSIPQKERTITSQPRYGEKIPVTTPTTIHAVLEFANGALITLGASWDIWQHGHRNMELYGTEGSLVVPDPNFFGGELLRSERDGEFEAVAAEHHPFGIPNQENPRGAVANYRASGLADLAVAIQTGRDARCSIERPLHGVEVMTAILKSADTRQTLELQTTCTQPAPLTAEEAQSLLR
ncbi:MAG: Gfo/Idh/MocA family protein [bacterium]